MEIIVSVVTGQHRGFTVFETAAQPPTSEGLLRPRAKERREGRGVLSQCQHLIRNNANMLINYASITPHLAASVHYANNSDTADKIKLRPRLPDWQT